MSLIMTSGSVTFEVVMEDIGSLCLKYCIEKTFKLEEVTEPMLHCIGL